MHRQCTDRTLQQFMARPRKQKRLGRVMLNGEFRSFFLAIEIERYGHRNFQALARGQKRVPQDAIDPCPEICAQLKRREPFQCPNVGFLN